MKTSDYIDLFSKFLLDPTNDETSLWEKPFIEQRDKIVLNEFLSEFSSDFIWNLIFDDVERFYDGWSFFDSCYDIVESKNIEKFLRITWEMFSHSKDNWHPWYGTHDPMFKVNLDSIVSQFKTEL